MGPIATSLTTWKPEDLNLYKASASTSKVIFIPATPVTPWKHQVVSTFGVQYYHCLDLTYFGFLFTTAIYQNNTSNKQGWNILRKKKLFSEECDPKLRFHIFSCIRHIFISLYEARILI